MCDDTDAKIIWGGLICCARYMKSTVCTIMQAQWRIASLHVSIRYLKDFQSSKMASTLSDLTRTLESFYTFAHWALSA